MYQGFKTALVQALQRYSSDIKPAKRTNKKLIHRIFIKEYLKYTTRDYGTKF